MKDNFLSIGINIAATNHSDLFKFVDTIGDNKRYIHDLHFAYPNPDLCKTGRSPQFLDKGTTISYLRILSITGYKTTFLLNCAEEKNFEAIVEDLKEYVDNGLSAVCTQKIELGKMIKQAYPQLDIHGSCLSYKLRYEEFEDEIKAGYKISNPINNIIRDPYNLKRNHEMGLKQKILIAEGCLNHCPFESIHRKYISNGVNPGRELCESLLDLDKDRNNLILFLKANWVTIKRMIELEEYVDVLKIARGTFTKKGSSLYHTSIELNKFIENYNNTQSGNYINYNVLSLTAAAPGTYLSKKLKNGIDSKLIDDFDMFNHMNDEATLKEITKIIFKLNE